MYLLEKLRDGKGTVSSALGKELAKEVLDGNINLLEEAISLTSYNITIEQDKNIRAGAAKIVEKVAEKKPQLLSDQLEMLLPALEAKEPQTKWMIFQAFRYCVSFNEITAKKSIPYGYEIIKNKNNQGVCLLGAIDLLLGQYGSLSRENTEEIFNILEESSENCIKNEHDWILEAYIKIAPHLDKSEIETIISFVSDCSNIEKKATQKRVEKLYKLLKINL